MDDLLSLTGLSSWRTAADCLALDRLWLPTLSTGLTTIEGRKAVFDRRVLPDTDEGWAQLGQVLLLGLARRAQPESALDPLLGILFAIAWEGKVPRSETDLADLWWSSPANSVASGLPNREQARQLSDRDVRQCLVMFGDSGAWTMQSGK